MFGRDSTGRGHAQPGRATTPPPTVQRQNNPFSVPTEPVRIAMAELGFADPHEHFIPGLRDGLVTRLVSVAARSQL